jgi:formylglycine-generating enzyme required for sulfatase activity
MKSSFISLLIGISVIKVTMAAPLVTLETIKIGNADNAADSTGFGAVGHEYSISKYEITLHEYSKFLNAVASLKDPEKPWLADLYDQENMEDTTDVVGQLMERTGQGTLSSPYIYNVVGDPARPVPWVTWFNAARFANWLHNGAEAVSDTESGAYTLNNSVKNAVIRKNANARYWLPSEDEWYKAAFYNPTKGTYSNFPTRSNALPRQCRNERGSYKGINIANYNGCRPEKNKLIPVGSFIESRSYYGLFDMAGNLWEWNDGIVNDENRVVRGGSWSWGTTSLHKTHRRDYLPQERDDDIGFRIATNPSK